MTTLSDKTLTCVECGGAFTFTVGEQEFFASKGYTNEPKRCPNCRDARKSQQGGGGYGFGGGGDAGDASCGLRPMRRGDHSPIQTPRRQAGILQ